MDGAPRGQDAAPLAEGVVKIGGGLLPYPHLLEAALRAVGSAASTNRLLVVPGGGPFADTVRTVGRHLPLTDEAAHWMAVLAMDQYAHVIATRVEGFEIADSPGRIAAALAVRKVPVLAPYRLMREADPLPHSWDVTSDSIAAWIAGVVGARRLLLVKPPGVPRREGPEADGPDAALEAVLDPYFLRALPPGVSWSILPADEPALMEALLRATRPGGRKTTRRITG